MFLLLAVCVALLIWKWDVAKHYFPLVFGKVFLIFMAQFSALAFAVEDQFLNQQLDITMTSYIITTAPFLVWLLLFEKPKVSQKNYEFRFFWFKEFKHLVMFIIGGCLGQLSDTLLSVLVVSKLQNSQGFIICLSLPITLLIYVRW